MAAPKFVQAKKTTLQASISAAETTEILLKRLVDVYGNALAMSDFGTVLYLTIDPGGDAEEIMSATGFTVNADGSVSINAGIARGLIAKSPYGAGGTASAHAAGVRVVVSNNPQIYDAIIDYIDGIAIAGAPDASLTGKGLVEIATAAEIDADEDFGSTGASVAIRPDQLALSKYFLRLPTAAEKIGLGGAQGVISADNLFITEDKVTEAGTEQSQTTRNTSSTVGEANTTSLRNKIAQSFTPTKTKMRGVKMYKDADSGSFTGTVTIALQANSAGSPSGVNLASKTITNAEWLLIAAGEFEALFSSEYALLVAGNLYWIVISTSTSDTTNHPNFGANSAGGYTNGSLKYNNTTDGWVAVSTIDLYFKTLDGTKNQVVETNGSGVIEGPLYDDNYLGTSYAPGALGNTFKKFYYNAHLLFTLWTGATLNAAQTDFENWVRTNSTTVPVNPMGTIASFASTGDAILTLGNLWYTAGSTGLDYSDSHTIILDFFAKIASGAGEAQLGFFSGPSGVFGDNTSGAGFHIANSVLYALTQKADPNGQEVRTAITGVTLTRWNNYRIEFDMGADTVRFYVNGVLRQTSTGAGGAGDSIPVTGSATIGFGRDTTNPVQMSVTAPYFAIEVNP